ncbi:MAG TPA: diguanylate cyclase [Solirubrobacterales bacterium]|nr:diguanylate cyclase [Solirubrobacterales bacterium]
MKRSRRFWIGIAAVVAIAVGSVVAAVGVYVNDHDDFDNMQREDAVRAAHQAEALAALSVGKLSTAAAFAQTQARLTRHEFRVISRTLLGDGALDGAAYVPQVPAARRVAYERSHGVEIRERGFGPILQRAGSRPVYYPVTFGTSELGRPQKVRGYDLGSDPLRARVLGRARDTSRAVATPLVRLLIGGSGINVFWPVYRDGSPVATTAERRQALTGFIAGSFRVHDVAAAALAALPEDVKVQLRIDGRPAFGPAQGLEDAASVPIHIADRTWLLVVKDPGGPSVSLPIALAGLGLLLAALLASLIVGWSRNERMQELQRQAGEDSLTGLNNRRRFEEELAAAMARSRREGSTGALLILDLDEFKRVNDSRGHPAGDRVITEVATVLRRRIRKSDTLARLGGDEFAVILSRCSREEATLAAEGIARELREHRADGEQEPITASVGIAMFGEDPRTSLATVVSEADTAMYAAKDAGRDSVRLFDPSALREDARDPR